MKEYQTSNMIKQPGGEIEKKTEEIEISVHEDTNDNNIHISRIINQSWVKNLKDSNLRRFERIVELCDATIVFDENYRISYINKPASQIIKIKPELLIGKSLQMVFPEINWKSLRQIYEITRNNRNYFFIEQYIPSLNELFGVRIYSIQTGPIVQFFNITMKKKEEKRLKYNDQRYQTIVENMVDIVFTLDLDLKTTYVSPSVENLLGESVEKNMSKSIEEKIPPKQLKKLKEILAEEINYGNDADYDKNKIIKLETKHFRSDGSTIWLSMNLSFQRDDDGNIIGIQGGAHDITSQKKIAKKLIKSEKSLILMNNKLLNYNSQIILKNEQLNAALKKADESDRLKSVFLANLSHEIRTPMNGILGFSQLLQDLELEKEKQKNYLETIDTCGRHLLGVIDDIMSISKIELGQVKMSYSKTNINKQIRAICDSFSSKAKQIGIGISCSIPQPMEEPILNTDKDKVFAILTNLVKNALKFTNSGIIEIGYKVRTSDNVQELEFFVKDTGIGISKEQQNYIFEKFRKGDESLQRNIEGTGLGLAISKAYVEMLGGNIWVESIIGKGSIFYFTIPFKPIIESPELVQKSNPQLMAVN